MMQRHLFVSKVWKQVAFAVIAALMVAGLAFAPQSVASACGGDPGSCVCPGC
ncbi:MAG: hypothetical protein ABI700_06310 [Chloroflexota bacterium]